MKLFKDDIQDIVKTATIMSFVGVGANRMSEIASRSNEPATNLSRPIKKLIDLGFLGKDIPFDADEEKKQNLVERLRLKWNSSSTLMSIQANGGKLYVVML